MDSYPIGSMYAIYGMIYHQQKPQMLAFVFHTWILWVYDPDTLLGFSPLVFFNGLV